MRYIPFDRPDYYDERLKDIDEEIVRLMKQRKELSDKPGIPTKDFLTPWAKKYDFYEEYLSSIFEQFLREDSYRPVVEPTGFLKNIPVLKSSEKDDVFYSVTFVRQFANASVVHLNIDRNEEQTPGAVPEQTTFDLSVVGEDAEYSSRFEGGGGSWNHTSYTYVVSPALPDDFAGLTLLFKEYEDHFCTLPTGFEFEVKMDKK